MAMELSAGLLVLICLGATLAGLWHTNLAAREAANRAAISACDQLHLQFLDGTVAFAGLRVVRGPTGWLTLRRSYVFDYTADSIARRRGFVVMTGPHVDSVGFERDAGAGSRLADAAPSPGRSVSVRPRQAQIVEFDDWRRTVRRDPAVRDDDN
jgi:hypothetical protein